jgi:hypothetical protein
MKGYFLKAATAVSLAAFATGANANINFTTFVTSSDIAAAEGGNTSVIAFNYTGMGFVGSVYPNVSQLYSTDLLGGNVTKFGQPIPGFSNEDDLWTNGGRGDSRIVVNDAQLHLVRPARGDARARQRFRSAGKTS